jgi:putative transposase
MARRLRVEFPGAIYHVMNRGNRRESIFHDDSDRQHFLDTLAESCAKTGWQVQAYCLMPDHFHLVVETPQGNLVSGMKWLMSTYTARFNRRHKQSGHLFCGRYKAVLVEGQGGFLRTACDYVHLNPVRAKLLRAEAPLRSYRWSSLPALLAPPNERPAWQRANRLFGECGIPQDTVAGRREFEQRMEELRTRDQEAEFQGMRRAWCFGSGPFRLEVLGQLATKAGSNLHGADASELAGEKASRIVEEELTRLGWRAEDLDRMRKGDSRKLAIVRRLRAETTVTLEWIAQRLRMGTRGYLVHLLYWEGRSKPAKAAVKKASAPKPGRAPEPRAEAEDALASFDTSFD